MFSKFYQIILFNINVDLTTQFLLKREKIEHYQKYLVDIKDFRMLRTLGRGSFAAVYLAKMLDTKQLYAIKAISKTSLRSNGNGIGGKSTALLEQVMKERTALVMASRYPDYYVKLMYAFQNRDELFLVMEYMRVSW